MFRRLKHVDGVTLVEVMMAVLLFMISIASLLAIYLQSMTMAKRADYEYKTYNIAKSRIESLKSISFVDLTTAAETGTLVDEYGVPDNAGRYSRTTTVTPNYSGNAALTQVEVNVSYYFSTMTSLSNPTQLTAVFYSNG